MKAYEKFFAAALALVLILNVTGCVMLVAVSETVERAARADRSMMEAIQNKGVLAQPDSMPVLNDSVAYYAVRTGRTEGKGFDEGRYVKMHRFFFKRACYTDSVYTGFSVVVAEVDGRGYLMENQPQVTVAESHLGTRSRQWREAINYLTGRMDPYFALDDEGLKLRSLLRSAKF